MLVNPSAEADAGGTEDRSADLVRNASKLSTEWAQNDPQAAARWASGLPTGETRLWVMKNLTRQWAEYEPAAAIAWARSLPAAERTEVEADLAIKTTW